MANTGPINPQATAQVTVNFRPRRLHDGDQAHGTDASSGAPSIRAASLHIGHERAATATTSCCSRSATASSAARRSATSPCADLHRHSAFACAITACVQYLRACKQLLTRLSPGTGSSRPAAATPRRPPLRPRPGGDLYALVVFLHKNCNSDLFEAMGVLELEITQIKLLHHLEDQRRAS